MENGKWHASISACVSNLSKEQKNVTLQIKVGEDNIVTFDNKVLLPKVETLLENSFEFPSVIY